MDPTSGTESGHSHKRAVLHLVLGQSQVMGATFTLVVLFQQGLVPLVIWAAGVTGLVSMISLVLFRFIWREKVQPEQSSVSRVSRS
jgi:hypothetical protein